MPTTYTHDYFGRLVYRGLPAEMKDLIRRNGHLYRIGLHGPDILFYYMMSKNRVSQTGVRMHKTPARGFFERGMALASDTGDEALAAYLLGFGCHYLLDSACHPFVNQMADQKVISHTLLEKELDRKLMLLSGEDPYKTYPSDGVVPKKEYALTIHQAIPEVSSRDIFLSLKMMKFLTNRMVCDDGGRRRRVFYILFHLLGRKFARNYIEFLMMPEPPPGSEIPVRTLLDAFQEAVPDTIEELQNLFHLYKKDGELGPRWDLTYNG